MFLYLFSRYPNVNIHNFSTSWRDGMAFNAILHKHRPDLIDFDKLKKSNAHHNLQNAFNLAEQHLGIHKLLDVEGSYRVHKHTNTQTHKHTNTDILNLHYTLRI
jgi:hypothetical protein